MFCSADDTTSGETAAVAAAVETTTEAITQRDSSCAATATDCRGARRTNGATRRRAPRFTVREHEASVGEQLVLVRAPASHYDMARTAITVRGGLHCVALHGFHDFAGYKGDWSKSERDGR